MGMEQIKVMLHTSLAKSQNDGILFKSIDPHMKIGLCLSVALSVGC